MKLDRPGRGHPTAVSGCHQDTRDRPCASPRGAPSLALGRRPAPAWRQQTRPEGGSHPRERKRMQASACRNLCGCAEEFPVPGPRSLAVGQPCEVRSRPARAIRAASQAPTPPDGAWSACARIAGCATERSRPIGHVALQPRRTGKQVTRPRHPLLRTSPRCKRGFQGVARPWVAASSEMTCRHMRRRRRALGAGHGVRGVSPAGWQPGQPPPPTPCPSGKRIHAGP